MQKYAANEKQTAYAAATPDGFDSSQAVIRRREGCTGYFLANKTAQPKERLELGR
jgi:hypothetical protein